MSVAPEQAAPTLDAAPARRRSGLVPYRIDVGQYLRMIEEGILPSGAKVELLGGVLAKKMTKNAPHNFATMQLANFLRSIVPEPWIVLEEKSLVVGAVSRPEPDVSVVRGPGGLYRAVDPKAADAAIVVEVADSSYAKDRGIKFRLYAAAGIPVYWIVNLPEARVEVFTDPEGSGRSAVYRTERRFGAESEVPVEIEGAEAGRIPVRELLA